MVVLGVTGGISAYKAVEVCRRLVEAGVHVVPVLTAGALRFVGATTFSALASEPVQTSLWAERDPIPHTRLGQRADLVVLCPATARLIAAYAAGLSDDLLTATLLATRAPVVLCPAMHTEMWEHPAVQDNLAVLRRRGVHVVEPGVGRLAGGDVGAGRLAEPADIVGLPIEGALQRHPDRPEATSTACASWSPPAAPVSPSTRSGSSPTARRASRATPWPSGPRRAAPRSPWSPPCTGRSRPASRRVAVDSAAEMEQAVLERSAAADIVVMAAAVADFRPVAVADKKLKKHDGTPDIVLEPTTDILVDLGAAKPDGQVLVGFAAETDDVVANAVGKLERKGADLIVANDVAAPEVGFEHDTNAVTIVTSAGTTHQVALSDKRAVARAVLDAVVPQSQEHP